VLTRISLAVFGAGAILACSHVTSPAPATADANSVPGASSGESFDLAIRQPGKNVAQTWADNCAKCHGANGEGAGATSLLTEEKFDQKYDRVFFDAIKNGLPDMGMEAFGETMGDAEIWGQVVHIRELQAKALRAKNGSPKAANGVYASQRHKFRIVTVVEDGQGLKTPWGIDWLPDGTMLVTNRPGFVVLVSKDGKVGPQLAGFPPSIEFGQGGLMEVAVHPDYAKNGWIYFGLNDPKKDGSRAGFTKIIRGKLQRSGDQATLVDQQTIFEVDQRFYNGSGVHFGNRIAFDGKGHVFFAIGERGAGENAQDTKRPNGKVYRLNEDGTVPSDNPFASSSDPIEKAVWSYGHRNPQGLVFDLEGNLWDTEHGPRGGDEVNLIQKGHNYGWPNIAFSINYNGSPYRVPWPSADQKYTLPAFRWLPSIGACGLDVAKGPAFPNWKGDLLAGGLSGANVDRLRFKNGVLVEREELIHGLGRVREVAVGPDGSVYVALNQPDKIIRLVAAD